MTTTINASTSAGLVQTADTSGILQLQTASTAAVTIDASQNTTLAGTLTTTGITNSGVATATRFNPTGSSVTGNGMYLPAANSLGLSTNGTNAVYIDSSQNVGIGVTPSYKLDVLGGNAPAQIASNDSTASVGLTLKYNTSTVYGYLGNGSSILSGASSSDFVMRSQGALVFATNGNNRQATIDTSGNLLVGATTPYSGTASNFTTTTGVDIGSSSTATSKQLQFIRNGSTGTAGNIYATAGSFSNYCGIEFVIENVGGGSQAGYLKFNTTSSATSAERGRFDSSGNLLVGFTSATATPAQGVGISGSSSAGVYIGHASGTPSGNYYQAFSYNGSAIGSITQNGTTNIAYNTSSDYRLKENIQPMQNALATISQLKPVTYKWKTDGTDGQGFIAHELQAVVPDCVTGDKDGLDDDGNPKYQGVDTSFLVATLTAAIQELKAINDTQAETINALTARIVALEAK